MENVFEWLQKWYQSQYNGDWEHEYGITIETVDNPGWHVTIDLTGTECEEKPFSGIKVETDELSWYFCLVRDRKFEASCGPCHLSKVLEIFRDWVND